MASGADLRLGLHVLTGHKDGPTLGILTTIHGDETFPLMAVRELLNSDRCEGAVRPYRRHPRRQSAGRHRL